ncbi:MAG: flagellar biosynthesis anti-sigma factor FlgM [Bdellovibrionales bacterium]
MKITHNKIGQNLNLVDGPKSDKASHTSGARSLQDAGSSSKATGLLDSMDAAKVEVSSRAQEAQKIKELAMATPDVDMQKVEKFRRLIDAGQYKVDAKAIADKMVDEHLETKN